MQQFNAALVNEMTKIFRRRKTVLFCLADIAIILLFVVFNSLSSVDAYMLSALGSMFSMHNLFFMLVFPLYIFIETMDIFTGEMDDQTIRNALVRPVARMKIYLAKVCAVCTFIFVQILLVGVIWASVSVYLGEKAGNALKNIAAFAISFIPMIAFVFFAAFVAQIAKNGLIGMLLCIFFLIVSYTTEALAPTAAAFLFTRHINLHKMLLTGNIQFSGSFSALLIIVAYIGVTFTAGVLIFEKKEF